MQQNTEKNVKIKKSSKKNSKKKILILDTSKIKSFYDDNKIHKYLKSNVIYIAIIGKIGKYYLCKFGKSSRVLKRDLIEHRKTFGNQFKIIYIRETDNNSVVEDIFKDSIKVKELYKKMIFNGQNRDELFVTSDLFTIQDAIKLMNELIDEFPLDSLKKRDDEIFKMKLEHEQLLKREETRQKELDNVNLELKNKNLELNIKFMELQKTQNDEEKNDLNNDIKDIKEEIKNDIKEEIKNEIKEELDIYRKFFDDCTEESECNRIHCSDLYVEFTNWIKNDDRCKNIPSNKEFVKNVRKIKKVHAIKINKKSNLGVRSIKIKK
jgi:hypothetical protein